MFLPIGDQPNPPGTPVANYTILAANVLIYIALTLPLSFRPADPSDPRLDEYVEVIRQNLPPGASVQEVLRQVSAYDLFVFSWGYRPAEPSVLALFASMFLHGEGFAHLFGNMLFLWIYGDNVEHRLGSGRYVLWYLLTGACATLFHSVFDSDSRLPLVGASGAISGVLGFYFVWFPRNSVRVWVLLFPFFMNVVLLPARLVLGFYLILDSIFPFLLTRGSQGAGVAYGAHIGGFLAGLAVAWLKGRREVAARPTEYRDSPRVSGYTAREALDALRRQDMGKAAKLYFEMPADETRRLLSPDDSIALANWLAKNGHSRAALTLYQRHIRDYPRGPGAAEAHAYAGLLLLHALWEPTAAFQHLVEALEYDPGPELESMIRRALQDIESRQKMQVPRFH